MDTQSSKRWSITPYSLTVFLPKWNRGKEELQVETPPKHRLSHVVNSSIHDQKPHKEDVPLTWWDGHGTWSLWSSSHDHSSLIMKKLHTNFHRGCPTHTPQKYLWTSLVVQWLRLFIPSTVGMSSVPGWVKSWMPHRPKKKGFKG